MEEAAQYGVFVTAHAHGAEGIKRAVRAGVRSIEHASYLDDEGIALMKKHGTWLVADIYNGDYIDEIGRRDGWTEEIMRKNRETTQTQRDGFAKAAKAGVRIAYGTDSGVYPHGENARQFAYMVRYGLSPMDAIRSATLSSAQLLGTRDAISARSPSASTQTSSRSRAIRCRTSSDCAASRGVIKGGNSIVPVAIVNRASTSTVQTTHAHDSHSRAQRAARQLGFWMCLALVVGNIIGSGVFLLPASLAPYGLNSIFGWLVTAAGACCSPSCSRGWRASIRRPAGRMSIRASPSASSPGS